MEEQFYTKLTKKYRPTTLDDVFGQESAVTRLKGMFKEKRIANAILLSGSSGCGKTTLGRIYFKYVNCENFDYDKVQPCGKCNACTSENSGDFSEVDGATNRGIDDVRNIKEMAGFRPQFNYRVILIDEVHALTPQAFQALLKILEEPPEETIFILCTTEPEKLPETVLGRCTHLDIASVCPEDIVSLLAYISDSEYMPNNVFNDDLFVKIAKYSRGHVRNAITALESIRDYVAGKGAVANVTELLNDINNNVLKSSEWQIALKYLLSIYRGKYTGALRAIENVKNYEGFVKLLMEYNTQCLYWLLSDKLIDKYYYQWIYDELVNYNIPKTDEFVAKLSKTMEILVKTAFDIKSYLVDAKYIMISMTTKFSTMFRNNDNHIDEIE